MDEFFRTPMGRDFFDHTMPEIARQLKRLADAQEKKNVEKAVQETLKVAYLFNTEKELANWLVKENILRYANEDELFALFHTFKEYYNELPGVKDSSRGWDSQFMPMDSQIGEVIKKLKLNYK